MSPHHHQQIMLASGDPHHLYNQEIQEIEYTDQLYHLIHNYPDYHHQRVSIRSSDHHERVQSHYS